MQTPPRGCPRFGNWDSPSLLLIIIQTNKSRFGDMLLTELVSGETGKLTLWWIEAHSLSMKRLTANNASEHG